jgi:hypothetical protein
MLTIKDCKDFMDHETLIGSDKAKDGLPKRFTFNAWMDEYSIWHDNKRISGGLAIDELLEEYNEL